MIDPTIVLQKATYRTQPGNIIADYLQEVNFSSQTGDRLSRTRVFDAYIQ